MVQRARLFGGVVSMVVVAMIAAVLLSPALSVAAQESTTVDLAQLNDSGITGTATFTADGDQTIVSLQLVGAEEGFEGHFFDSTCDNHAAATVFYALDPVDADLKSETTVDVKLSDITNGKYWVHIHQSAAAGGKGVACGPIPDLSGSGGALPDAGVGPIETGTMSLWMLLAGVFVAMIAAAGAVRLKTAERGSRQ